MISDERRRRTQDLILPEVLIHQLVLCIAAPVFLNFQISSLSSVSSCFSWEDPPWQSDSSCMVFLRSKSSCFLLPAAVNGSCFGSFGFGLLVICFLVYVFLWFLVSLPFQAHMIICLGLFSQYWFSVGIFFFFVAAHGPKKLSQQTAWPDDF